MLAFPGAIGKEPEHGERLAPAGFRHRKERPVCLDAAWANGRGDGDRLA